MTMSNYLNRSLIKNQQSIIQAIRQLSSELDMSGNGDIHMDRPLAVWQAKLL